MAALLTGCATRAPWPRPLATHALPAATQGPLATLESALRARHGDAQSGFRLLQSNLDALTWRLALIDSARQSIDLQVYVWFGDHAGQLLLARVRAAADRGVRVRLLFDDLTTVLHDMAHVELRDAALAELDRHPHLEIRVFNPWVERGLFGRLVESGESFERLNRRMHNKQMVVDGRAAVIGGRNVGDEYFGLNRDFNFHDLDVLGVGPVAREAASVFDRYWNSDWVRGLPPSPEGRVEPSATALAEREALEADPRARRVLAGRRTWDSELAGLADALHPGRSAVHADSPSRAPGLRNHMPEAFRALMRSAQREVLITNAYIIPDAAFVDDLAALAARGVRVRLLTNSLASHDVPAVNSHYEGWRPEILRAGAVLHELRPDPAMQAEIVDVAPVRAAFTGLHTKAMVIDRERSFVGSMNLDPRSEVDNAEMGVVIDSPSLAASLADAMERDMASTNSWRVELAADGRLRWHGAGETLERQPARNLWQRVQNLLFKLFPANLY